MEDKVYVLQTYYSKNDETTIQVFRSLIAAQEEMVLDISSVLKIMVDDAYFDYVQTTIHNTSAKIYNVVDDELEYKWVIEEAEIK